MSSKSFIQGSLATLHTRLNEALEDLTPEQLNWRSPLGGNPISFTIWHYARTEDNLIQFALQRKPTVWQERGLAEKFGLDPRAQGTGMSAEDAAKVRLPSVQEFQPYLAAVWKNTEEFLAGLDEAELTREIELRGLGKPTYESILGNTLMTHGYGHLGEIWYVKGLQGLKGSPI
ncbi:MAG TPA: DinB family protein [Dehalococcoidia bacterium]|nr:DinB family protein [Dehalococcoidia bacterium]